MKTDPKARRWARRFALQAMYQWQLSGNSLPAIEEQFVRDENASKSDFIYFKDVLHGVMQNLTAIDTQIVPHLDRPVDQVDPIELAILRIATYELLKRPDVPYKVVINEALELTKSFGATDGHKFVNGILDRISQQLRKIESNAAK